MAHTVSGADTIYYALLLDTLWHFKRISVHFSDFTVTFVKMLRTQI